MSSDTSITEGEPVRPPATRRALREAERRRAEAIGRVPGLDDPDFDVDATRPAGASAVRTDPATARAAAARPVTAAAASPPANRAAQPTPMPRRRGWALTGILLVAAVAIAAATRALVPDGSFSWLPTRAQDFLTLSTSVFIESLPFVFLGTALSVLVQEWLPPTLFDRLLPRSGFARRAVISLLGILLPVCECGNVPLARGLLVRGLSVGESVTFILAAPLLNPVTIITTYQAFGWSDGILVSRILGGFVIANLVGWLVSRHPDERSLLTPDFEAACRVAAGHAHRRSVGARVRRSADMFATETSAMLPALAIGSAIAGGIQMGLPRELLLALGANPVWSVAALMLLAFIVSLCSNVDAFFVLSLSATFMPGALVAFLVFGAMLDVKMLVLLRSTFTFRALALITAVVALAVAALGLGVNLVV